MPQSHAAIYCHIVFSTKDREPYIDPSIQERLYEYIGGLVRERNSLLVAAGGIADHVHLLISMSRELAVAPAVRDIKSNSSRWIHETFPELACFAWQAGYGAFSVSASCLEQVKAYLANQTEHHRKRTFQEEYREMLRLAGLEFDERYVWD